MNFGALKNWGNWVIKYLLPGAVGMDQVVEVVLLAEVTGLAIVQTMETSLSCAPNLFPATTEVQNTKILVLQIHLFCFSKKKKKFPLFANIPKPPQKRLLFSYFLGRQLIKLEDNLMIEYFTQFFIYNY
jgi:hypothetical protein